MSIDLNWEALTTGPDGEELAHRIRDFIHTKFQAVPLPRFIKSVTVHDFQFGSIPPELELKDITDPLPDFYEEDIEDEEEEEEEEEDDDDDDDDNDDDDEDDDAALSGDDTGGRFGGAAMPHEPRAAAEWRRHARETPGHYDRYHHHHRPHPLEPSLAAARTGAYQPAPPHDLGSPFLGVSTPGIPGGTSNLHYFHSHLAPGLSGTQTPLAAVAGAQIGQPGGGGGGGGGPGWLATEGSSSTSPPSTGRGPGHSRNPSQSSIDLSSTLAATSAGASRPPTRDAAAVLAGSAIAEDEDGGGGGPGAAGEGSGDGEEGAARRRRFRRPRVEDLQAVFRIRYAGDVKLLLTADILLDYPMPSFVGIPLRLSITGLTFDGVGVLASIRRRVHFCFLSPEDAVAAVGAEEDGQGGGRDGHAEGGGGGAGQQQQGQQQQEPPHGKSTGRLGGLLQEIRVESEIGQREGGKQSLKNVGKVERFVLEQVRRIFEEEFVYPSFWTFLV